MAQVDLLQEIVGAFQHLETHCTEVKFLELVAVAVESPKVGASAQVDGLNVTVTEVQRMELGFVAEIEGFYVRLVTVQALEFREHADVD